MNNQSEEEDEDEQYQPQVRENKGDKLSNDLDFMLGTGTRRSIFTGFFKMMR